MRTSTTSCHAIVIVNNSLNHSIFHIERLAACEGHECHHVHFLEKLRQSLSRATAKLRRCLSTQVTAMGNTTNFRMGFTEAILNCLLESFKLLSVPGDSSAHYFLKMLHVKIKIAVKYYSVHSRI